MVLLTLLTSLLSARQQDCETQSKYLMFRGKVDIDTVHGSEGNN